MSKKSTGYVKLFLVFAGMFLAYIGVILLALAAAVFLVEERMRLSPAEQPR
ncbi:MAG: hypothetical protein II837_00650 [Treponema sp.]|nr:hypothetical protein [Treponema sp.]MBQ3798777.1 hypothetical protein [Treponema sp.]MBQ6567267.1 hypothetical protein [Treponema sp.]